MLFRSAAAAPSWRATSWRVVPSWQVPPSWRAASSRSSSWEPFFVRAVHDCPFFLGPGGATCPVKFRFDRGCAQPLSTRFNSRLRSTCGVAVRAVGPACLLIPGAAPSQRCPEPHLRDGPADEPMLGCCLLGDAGGSSQPSPNTRDATPAQQLQLRSTTSLLSRFHAPFGAYVPGNGPSKTAHHSRGGSL